MLGDIGNVFRITLKTAAMTQITYSSLLYTIYIIAVLQSFIFGLLCLYFLQEVN